MIAGRVQPPSLALCADQCHARCCRAPGFVRLSRREAERMAQRVPGGIVTRELPGERLLVMNYGENGGHCPMLDDATSRCRIYAHRPVACHDFPTAPFDGCLVWPGAPACS